ncbi:MFS transporter [Clostridium oceanicum]|uniref:Major facilitator superfamily (MFS) profile domain-containing protein n=1 Tax=Clostridium oceanicum TaxID=1543 RepID=A0ABP3UET8_9CLOT
MKKTIREFKTTYFVFNFVITVFAGFLLPYMKHMNLSNSYIGIITAIMTVSGILGQVITGYLCDVNRTIKKIFILWEIILTILVIIFSIVNRNLYYLVVLLFLIGFVQSALCSLIDSWIIEKSEEIKNKFGPIRAYGSIGAGIASILFGYLTDKYGWNSIFIAYPIIMLILIMITFKMKDVNKNLKNAEEKKCAQNKITMEDIKLLFSNTRYVYLIFIFLILYMSLKVITMFSVLNIKSISEENWYFGVYTFITAFSEIPIFIYSPKIMKKVNSYYLLIFASLFFIIRIIMVATSRNVYTIIASGIFHMTTFSFIALSSKYLIDEVSPENLKTTSQMVAMAIYLSLGDSISSLISGIMSDFIGTSNTLFVFCGLCVIAFIMSIRYNKKYNCIKVRSE